MSFTRLALLFAAAHLVIVISMFLLFGIGLEGKRHLGHFLFWILMMPGVIFPGLWLPLLLNSVLWGVCCAFLYRGVQRIRAK